MFSRTIRVSALLWLVSAAVSLITAQQVPSSSAVPVVGRSAAANVVPTVVPNLVKYSGVLAGKNGKPQPEITGVTFLLYKDATGGAPLWIETQNVHPDSLGHYSVMLGSTNSQGLPKELFTSGDAHWLAVQTQGQPEQPRVLLLSVPYALKAADAETLGGLPAAAFMLAAPAANSNSSAAAVNNSVTATGLPPASSNVTTTGGTVNAIPLFTTATNIQKSILTQTTTTAINVGGKLNLLASGTATATLGKNSWPQDFVASTFNSSSNAAVPQKFQLQAEPVGNDTASPSGTLNLLYGSGTAAPTETGLKINNKGVITFASGQTFPGNGTISGVTAGTGLTGGGTSGVVTLNIDATKVPELGVANNFTAPQDFKANVGIAATPSATGYTPLTVGGTTTFGTWLAIGNSSAGGHTWNIISAGSGNAEGAGNLGITDLTGKSTIWLEGNTNTNNLTAVGNLGSATLVVTSTAGASIIDADGFGKNTGGPTPGLRFGGGSSGEGIASNRVGGATKFGLDFYTNYTPRMSIFQTGQVSIGTASHGAQLSIVASSNTYPAIYAQAADAPSGSGQTANLGIEALGGGGDGSGDGGAGVAGYGGGGASGGAGGEFFGAYSTVNLIDSGDGIDAYSVDPTADFLPAAGFFDGNVIVNGSVSDSSLSLKIDHPLDPANKYLLHAAVESSEMKTIYDGNVTTDASGEAIVELPEWFEALNRDYRYQLTVLGQFARAIVAEKIANHRFTIRTDKPHVEVSWQVTGIRQDAWANAHRTPVEVAKSARERGRYLHPELYGAPEESSIEWARHPQTMKRLKVMREQAAARQSASVTR